MFDLAGRNALITGSSSGIGYALAQALAAAGARIILNGRSQANLDAASSQFRSLGWRVDTACFDVTDPSAVNRAIAAVESDIGPLDILINNAGIQRRGLLEEFDDRDWRELMSTNVDSVYYVGKAVARHMIPRGRGKIINIGSALCELARPGVVPYAASKGAVMNLTRGMCADWAKHGLQINAIAPGYFATPMNQALVDDPVFDEWIRKRTPMQRWGRLEDLHGIAVFLASSASDFVNGQTIYVDGGITSVL